MQPEHVPRLFTCDEASALLPALRPLLRGIQADKRGLDEARQRLAQLTAAVRANGGAVEARALSDVIERAMESLRAAMESIQRMGVELKDLDSGLVDFPSQRGDRVVYLCWRVDEPDIAFWHELDAGVRGRQPL